MIAKSSQKVIERLIAESERWHAHGDFRANNWSFPMKIRRLVAAMGVAAAATLIPVATAAPAQADSIDCMEYLQDTGIYNVGPKLMEACRGQTAWTQPLCIGTMIGLGVRSNHAAEACYLAGR